MRGRGDGDAVRKERLRVVVVVPSEDFALKGRKEGAVELYELYEV
jgi:hypothetical protein